MISIATKISAFLDAPSRVYILLLFFPMLVVALLEMASIAMILPVINILMDQSGNTLSFPFVQWLFSDIPLERRLFVIVGVFCGIFVFKNISLFLMILIINRTIQSKLAKFSQRMFSIYLNRPLLFHLQQNSAGIIRNLHTSSARAFECVRVILMMFLEIILAVVAILVLLVVEPEITLIAATGLLAYGLLFHRIAGPRFQLWGNKSQILEGQMIKTISESLGSIRDIKLLNIQQYMHRMFALQTNDLAKYITRASTSQHIPRLSVETLVILGFAGLVFGLIIVKGSLDDVVSTIGLFAMASLRLMPSTNRILTGASDLKSRLAAVDVLYDDLISSRHDRDQNLSSSYSGTLTYKNEIRITDLTFSYSRIGEGAVKNLNLSIQRGHSIGIVGPSGGGKSTLLDLLLGLLIPQQGNITVDGTDIRTDIGAWQKHIGYVPQSIYLVDQTLRHNIAFGIDDDKIDEDRISVAVERSNLHSVVDELEHGLETRLGEAGTRLSGGQRQRVAIARALYRDPDVLVFDEATSSLDIETEREVIAAIERLKGAKTIIIITHKLSIVGNCDTIAFLEGGRIVDMGTLVSLTENNTRFRKFSQAKDIGSERKDGKFKTSIMP